MNSIKQFLKPTKKKILGALLLLIIFVFLTIKGVYDEKELRYLHDLCAQGQWCFSATFNYLEMGLPLSFIKLIYATNGIEINYFYFLLNLIFWYLVSCLLISAWDKIRKKTAA